MKVHEFTSQQVAKKALKTLIMHVANELVEDNNIVKL